jgi:hypothetical protein
MRALILFIAISALAAIAPFFSVHSGSTQKIPIHPQWPENFEGRALKQISLSKKEMIFAKHYPGKTAQFTDGKRNIAIKIAYHPTRKLHPANDCYKGAGYSIKPLPIHVDKNGNRWGQFSAFKKNEEIRVTERIFDNHGNSWTDVSSWYWAALFGNKTYGPWWAVTVSESTTAKSSRP